MKTETKHFDAVVVGAGTAGAAAAYHLARAGLDVALIERRALDKAGARWCNGVPPWMFERAALALPEPPEARGRGEPTLAATPSGAGRIALQKSPVWDVDMRLLVARLQRLARGQGVTLFERTQTGEFSFEGKRPVSLAVVRNADNGSPKPLALEARLFVDASGLGAVLRRQVRQLDRSCPEVPREHLCTAAQHVFKIGDKEAALAYLEKHGAEPGQVLSAVGVDGGFSTLGVTVDESLETVALLTGTIADGRHKNGQQLIDAFKSEQRWVGAHEFGGAGLIPIRRPYDRLAAPGLALIGNAACQVFPAHGSGIGIGLIAAKVLSEAAASHDDPGSLEAVWDYQARFQREFGPLLGAYDVFRRLSQRLASAEVDALFTNGFVTAGIMSAALEEKLPRLSVQEMLGTVRGAFNSPSLAAKFVPALLKMSAVQALYARYPARPSERALRLWSRAAAALFGERADLR